MSRIEKCHLATVTSISNRYLRHLKAGSREGRGATLILTAAVPTAAIPTTAVPKNLGQPHRYGFQSSKFTLKSVS